jgi:hypothetical protein
LTNPEAGCYHAMMVHVDIPPVHKGTDSPAAPIAVSTWTGSAREQAVQRMFTSIAGVYDLNNTLLSFGLHYRWKKITASYVPVTTGGRALDVGSGTADLALLVEPRMGDNGRVIASDLNHAMLVEGLKKVTGRGLGIFGKHSRTFTEFCSRAAGLCVWSFPDLSLAGCGLCMIGIRSGCSPGSAQKWHMTRLGSTNTSRPLFETSRTRND